MDGLKSMNGVQSNDGQANVTVSSRGPSGDQGSSNMGRVLDNVVVPVTVGCWVTA